MDIFINKNIWKTFDDREMKYFEECIFNHYREKGFPYFETDKEFRLKEFKKLKNSKYNSLLKDDVVGQSMTGLALCWSYMPHAFNVPCNNLKTPLEVFNNDEDFKKVIKKRIKMGDNISDNGIRKMLKIFTGTQCVSNFRPTASALIYSLYGKNKTVWDMSCGYGGRIFGAIVAGVKNYVGTEPCEATFNGIQQICDDFKPEWKDYIFKVGSERFVPAKDSLDLCFTSPPYFDTEKYSNEDSQSYKKFPNYNDWLNLYLKKTFENCYYGLKNDGKLVININDCKSAPNLVSDCKRIAESCGFVYEKELKYALSSISHKDKYKYEPILVFYKP